MLSSLNTKSREESENKQKREQLHASADEAYRAGKPAIVIEDSVVIPPVQDGVMDLIRVFPPSGSCWFWYVVDVPDPKQGWNGKNSGHKAKKFEPLY